MALRSSSCSVRNLCRSSSAENSSSASGLTLPSIASARSAVRSRLVCSSRSYGAGSGARLALGHLAGEGHELVGAVVGDQRLLVEAELLERALGELLDPHPLLGAGHLVAVDGVDQLVVLAGQVAQRPRGPPSSSCSRSARDASTAARASAARWIDTSSLARTTPTATPTAWAARPSRTSRSRRSIGPGARLALGLRPPGPGRRRGRAAHGRAPRWCAAPAGRPSRPAGPRGPPRRGARARRCRAPRRWRPRRRRAAASSSARPARSCSRASWAVGDRLGDPVGLGTRASPGLRAVVAELLGDGREGRVGLVQLGQRDVDPALGVLPLGLEPRDVEAEPLGGRRPPRPARPTRRRTPPGSRAGWAGSASRRRRSARRTRRRRGSPRSRRAGRRPAPGRRRRSATTAVLNSSRASAGRSVSGQRTTSTAYVAWPGRAGQRGRVGDGRRRAAARRGRGRRS